MTTPATAPSCRQSVPEKVLALAGKLLVWAFGRRSIGRLTRLTRVRRVVVFSVEGIGDVILQLPFLRALRRHAPSAHIELVVRPASADIARLSGVADQVTIFNPHSSPSRWGRLVGFARFMGKLVLRRYDLAILPRWDVDLQHIGVIVGLSGARWRVGFAQKSRVERIQLITGGHQLRLTAAIMRWQDGLLSHPVDDQSHCHEVRRGFNLLAAIGVSATAAPAKLQADQADERSVRSKLPDNYSRLVALCVGGASGRRMWPINCFAEVASSLADQGFTVAVLGGKAEAAMGQELMQSVQSSYTKKIVNLVGKISLAESAALLRVCEIYVGNDTGMMHLAAAMETPVVEISCHPEGGDVTHPNAPERFGPWGVPASIVRPTIAEPPCTTHCRYDKPHCILGISTAQVLEGIDQLSAGTRPHTTN